MRIRFWLTRSNLMNLASLLAQFTPGAKTHKIYIPPSWHQGRTSYGGLSSVLAYQAAKLAADDLPPLQSAQIAFVGPLAGDIEVSAHILRRGKNTAFIQVEVKGADGVGLFRTEFLYLQGAPPNEEEQLAEYRAADDERRCARRQARAGARADVVRPRVLCRRDGV